MIGKVYFFGINGAYFWRSYPKDDIDGSMVSSIYYIEKDLPRIVKYCEKDVLTLAKYLS